MLLKWLFTLLAIIWLYQAIQPFFAVNPPNNQGPANKKSKVQRRDDDNDGDYIDYEEIN